MVHGESSSSPARGSIRPWSYALAVAAALAFASPPAQATHRAVLVVTSERGDAPATQVFVEAMGKGLADPSGATQFFVENLDAARFPSPEHKTTFARYLRERYAGQRIDAVVLFGDPAYDVFRGYPLGPLAGAAVFAVGVEHGPEPASGLTGIPMPYDFGRTVALARTLQPDLREIVLVHGMSDFDVRRREEARRAVERAEPPLRYRLLGGRPFAEIVEEVHGLPRDSAVLFVSMLRDTEGLALGGPGYVRRLSEASPVPVYGLLMDHLENGALGGALTDAGLVGRATATTVVRMLAGAPAAEIPVEIPPTALRVNWRALEKWHIDLGRVPAEAQFVFRDPGLWETHRGMVVAAVVAFALQALLISGLVVQLRERNRAEAALKQSEERLRLSAEAAHLGMWGWSSSQDRMWATDNCRRLYGLPREGEISFANIVELMHPEDRPAVRRAVQDALHERRPFSIEYRLQQPGGEVRWIASQGRGSYGTGTDPVGVLGVSADITERKRAQETLREQQEELEHITRFSTMGQIAASLAHELSQPLGAILSNAQAGLRFLERGNLTPAELREILQEIVADDRRAGEVVAALRSMLRRDKSEATVLDLGQAARNVVSLLHSELAAREVEAETSCEPECRVLANKTQIEQVFVNLTLNAIEAMKSRPPGERRLRVEVSRANGAVSAAVRDSGPGIPPGDLERVFEPFWTTKASGMGMGLAICDTIVKSCGGAIRVEPNPGPGVTFTFTLPAA